MAHASSAVEPSIFEFSDFRDFLKKAQGRRSLGAWARKIRYRSPRSIAMVLKGQRLPSSELVRALSEDLKLSAQGRRYFELLVEKDRLARKGKGKELGASLVAELQALRPRTGLQQISEDATAMISGWHHLVIKQLLGAPEGERTVAGLAKKLRGKVSLAAVKAALEVLERLRVVRREGRAWVLEDPSLAVRTPVDLPSTAVRSHHRQMMERAAEALEEQAVLMREFVSLTLRMDRKRIPEAKKFIREFRDRFDREFEDLGSGEVFQLGVHFFSHTP